MLYTIENDELCVQVRDHGAELRSIKEREDETEYLWNGDPTWWRYSSPVLFPIVGKLKDNKYRVGGKTYELPSHASAASPISSSSRKRQTASPSRSAGRRNRSRAIRGNSSSRWPTNSTGNRSRSSGRCTTTTTTR